ncbi:VOC family protein [Nocardia sp. NPDC002869]|uniref:VOC family protein n=1 Tax=Nocardia sp. NPDC002869 TaxID=3161032 RepID=UPI00398D08E7
MVLTVVPVPLSEAAAHAESDVKVGVPHHIGFVVADMAATVRAFEAGTGARFTGLSEETVAVELAGEAGTRSVQLRRVRTVGGSPSLTFEHATPAIGPWADSAAATAFLSYAVDDVDGMGATLVDHGFENVARAADFGFWRNADGVLIRLIDRDSWSAGSGAAGDLGEIRSFTLLPCAASGLRDQLAGALGVNWKVPMSVPLPWQQVDGEMRPVLHEVHSSSEKGPHLSIETPAPVSSQNCAPGTTRAHLVYFTPDVTAAEQRMVEAGMTPLARVPGITTYFRAGTHGPYVEIGSTAFELAEYLP